jgi:hypothetical protein
MKMLVPAVALLILLTAKVPAIPITLFVDTDTFVQRAWDIVVAKCVGPIPDRLSYHDGLYPVDMQVVTVLKGAKKPGKLMIATIYPMEAGKTYLLTSLGGAAFGTDFLAVPQLAVVEVPHHFRLQGLARMKLSEQVQALFAARRKENEQRQKELEEEKKLLDKAVPK